MMTARTMGWLAAGLLAAAPLGAQTAPERVRLDSLRAVFAAMTDTAALIAREQERIAVARTDRDNPFIHMELGYLSYRLGELTAVRKRYEDAASEFTWASDLRPQWPYAWHWLGMSELAIGEARDAIVENIRQLLGQDALSLAATAFARALQADPGFSEALVELAATALRQRISPRLVVAQAALRLSANLPAARHPSVQLMRGRVERRLGEQDSALHAFRGFLAAGGDPGLGHLEVARTQALRDRGDSVLVAYADALRAAHSDSARAELRRDVRWIATTDELTELDALAPESVGVWMGRFWSRRDLADGRRRGERLIEQFRRLQVAGERYTLVSRRRGFDVDYAYRDTTQSEYDDRGIIYLRHGAPHTTATFVERGVEPNESWMYERAGQEPLIFHFVAREDTRDFRLIDNLASVYDPSTGVNLAANPGMATPMDLRNLYASRSAFGPLYERMARGGTAGRSSLLAEERNLVRRNVREGTTTDSWIMRFASDLRPVISTFLVQGADGRGELHAIFAIPAGRLEPVATERGVTYPLQLRLQVHDGGAQQVASVDTLRVFRAEQRLGEGSFLTEQIVVPVPAGRWHYRLVVQEIQRSSGSVAVGADLDVPRYGEAFEVSDVVLGREGSGLAWRRPEGVVPLNPLQRYAQGGEATLWYELYGLEQGASVETRVRITRRGGGSILRRIFGGGSGADLSYTTVTDAPGRARVRQTLGLSGLEPGRYELVVEFSARGRRLERRQPFEIFSRAP